MAFPTIAVDETGVWLQDGPDRRWGIKWDEIRQVSVSKFDAVDDVDTILAIDFESGHFIELNSVFPGFAPALADIARRLAGSSSAWDAAIDRLGPEDEPLLLWLPGPAL